MHYAFIYELGTLKVDLAQTERQIYCRSNRKNCSLQQLLPKEGGQYKINFFLLSLLMDLNMQILAMS